MPLPAQILIFAGMASVFLAIGSAYLAAPMLRARMKQATPSVDVPLFDTGDQRGMNRLYALLWTVDLPADRPRLRRMVLAHRAFLVAAPLLMVGAVAATALTPLVESAPRPRSGEEPPVFIAPSDRAEPAR